MCLPLCGCSETMHRRLLISFTMAIALVMAALPARSRAGQDTVTLIAAHLNQPKKLTIAANGDLVVALSGDGSSPSGCTDSDELSCEDRSGAVDEVTPSGHVTTLLKDLTSISSGHDDPQATGPVEARLSDGRLQVLFQDLDLSTRTGVSRFGSGSLLGDLVSVRAGEGSGRTVEAAFGPFEASSEPDRDALGSAVTYGYEAAINSDPYSFVHYRGGWAMADAGANDLLWVSPAGEITVLAVLPTIREYAKAGTYGSSQTTAIEAEAQAVPTSVTVGPDGALYVGELGGAPFATAGETIYRVVPGHSATVYATGFTAIGDIAFDAKGDLLVLELDKKGLADPGLDDNHPASGELLSVANAGSATHPRAGTRRVLLSSRLSMPGGLAVASDGDIYLTDDATSTGGGEILRVATS